MALTVCVPSLKNSIWLIEISSISLDQTDYRKMPPNDEMLLC